MGFRHVAMAYGGLGWVAGFHDFSQSMSHDTTAINRTRQDLRGRDSVWLFGYGSLIYKTGFPYLERRPARIRGWERRFWQGSHDHRGTRTRPGRVATLVQHEHAECVGMAYRVAPETFRQLDIRERNGYLRFTTPLYFDEGADDEALVYIATPDNAAWLGEGSDGTLARHIAGAAGHSGPNSEYLLKLADALRDLGADDPHVFALEAHLKRIIRALRRSDGFEGGARSQSHITRPAHATMDSTMAAMARV